LKKDSGFLLVDAMLSLSIIVLICTALIPMLHQMNKTYRESLDDVADYRSFYVYVKTGGTVIEQDGMLCKAGADHYCIKKR